MGGHYPRAESENSGPPGDRFNLCPFQNRSTPFQGLSCPLSSLSIRQVFPLSLLPSPSSPPGLTGRDTGISKFYQWPPSDQEIYAPSCLKSEVKTLAATERMVMNPFRIVLCYFKHKPAHSGFFKQVYFLLSSCVYL